MTNLQNTLYRYQKRALETAVYPGRGKAMGVVYCALKLAGEAGELLEKVLDPRVKDVEAVAKELGDIMWYVASLARELGSEIPASQGSSVGLTASDIVIVATQISELIGKAIRDEGLGDQTGWITSDTERLSAEKRAMVLDRLATITHAVERVARGLGLSLAEVCDMNIAKLASRAQRGVLAGSGDNR